MTPTISVTPRFFRTGRAFRAWLERNHRRAAGLIVGFHRVATGCGGLTYPEALDAALCFGWIDGMRRGIDAFAYAIRFSPRRPGSTWSLVNTKRVKQLIAMGLVSAHGLVVFRKLDPGKSGLYSFERKPEAFTPAELRTFKRSRGAWIFYEAQPPGWKRTIRHWVTGAKRAETRAWRLQSLIQHSARGERVSLLKPPSRGR